MSRSWRLYLDDIVDAADLIHEFTVDLSQAEFQNDQKTWHAVLRNLEIIGEAAKKTPLEVQHLAPSIPWRRIAGFRDRLAHGYFDIVDDVVWDVIQNHLPPLRAEAERLRHLPDPPTS